MSDKKLARAYDEAMEEIVRLDAEVERLRQLALDELHYSNRFNATCDRMRAALVQAEAVMMIVKPRSHTAEYLTALAAIRAALTDRLPTGKA